MFCASWTTLTPFWLEAMIHSDKIQYRSFGLLFENVGVPLIYRNAKKYIPLFCCQEILPKYGSRNRFEQLEIA